MARVMHIAEVGMRVTDLPKMIAFYQEVLGLSIVHQSTSQSPDYVFLKVGELDSPLGRGGHPQYLVLFDRNVTLDQELTTLDHLAFEISLDNYNTFANYATLE